MWVTTWVTAAKRYLKYLGSEDAILWGNHRLGHSTVYPYTISGPSLLILAHMPASWNFAEGSRKALRPRARFDHAGLEISPKTVVIFVVSPFQNAS